MASPPAKARQRFSRIALSPAAVVLLSLLPAGCAGGEQGGPAAAPSGRPPGPEEMRLVISRDFGAAVPTDTTAAAQDDLTVSHAHARRERRR